MRTLVTGGAGCIGSELAAALLARGDEVIILDNFSSGRWEHVEPLLLNPACMVIEGNVLDLSLLQATMEGVGMVWHMAANPDVKYSPGDPTDKDLRQNTIATYGVLEAARITGVKGLAFASTSAVYGVHEKQPLAEDAPCRPISLYGATKLACEAMISAFSHLFGLEAWIFRFANIVGAKVRRQGRTVIGDFIHRLREDPGRLRILGDGRQKKSYLTTRECIDAMLLAVQCADTSPVILNIAGEDSLSVQRIAEMVVEAMGLENAAFEYTGGEEGWPGDVPRFELDATRINRLGWRARLNSEQSVAEAIRAALEGTG